jgi:hypothetical protein
MVGAARFELTTPCAQGRCATRLRYAPTSAGLFILDHFPFRHPLRKPLSALKLTRTLALIGVPVDLLESLRFI